MVQQSFKGQNAKVCRQGAIEVQSVKSSAFVGGKDQEIITPQVISTRLSKGLFPAPVTGDDATLLATLVRPGSNYMSVSGINLNLGRVPYTYTEDVQYVDTEFVVVKDDLTTDTGDDRTKVLTGLSILKTVGGKYEWSTVKLQLLANGASFTDDTISNSSWYLETVDDTGYSIDGDPNFNRVTLRKHIA